MAIKSHSFQSHFFIEMVRLWSLAFYCLLVVSFVDLSLPIEEDRYSVPVWRMKGDVGSVCETLPVVMAWSVSLIKSWPVRNIMQVGWMDGDKETVPSSCIESD